ncbi:MAG: hypothetical protein WAN48_14710 [Actinomycetes bacterium]
MSYWRSGWKLWPDQPQGPVDDAFRQVPWVRPYRPGFPRVAFVVACAVLAFYPLSMGMLLALSPAVPVTARLVFLVGVVLPMVGVLIALGRGFASGVYVNDAGLRVVLLQRTVVAPWSDVVDVSVVRSRARGVGIPFVVVPAEVVVVTLRDTGPFRTSLTSVGPDFVGRAESFAIASGAVERWWRDAGGEARRRQSAA